MGVRIVADSLIGQTLGHYKVVDLLGAGGMGVVYRAQDLKLGRQVALKVLPAGSGGDEEAVERFRREARTASSLNHPNICTIYGFDEQDNQLYLAMELLDGDPLDRKMAGKPLDIRLALDIGSQVADALDAAHVGGILHRDIKPANIFLTRRGPIKVLDFGLAKLAPDFRGGRRNESQDAVPAHFSSVAGTTVGTIAYMSPEQARGEEVDQRTDLFSFGVVLYELVTGKQSFPGHTTAVIFDGILNRDPAPASTINPLVPPELDRIIEKALEKDRALRYQTAADFGADLKRLKRNSTTKQAIPAAAMQSSPDAATVVMPSGSAVAAPVSAETMTASQFARATAPTGDAAAQPAGPISQTTVKTQVRQPSQVVVPGTKTGWAMGAGAAIIGVAVVAGGIGAWMARGKSEPSTPAEPAAAVTTAATTSIPAANASPASAPAVAVATTTAPAPAPAATAKPAAPPTPVTQVAGASGSTGAKPAANAKTTPTTSKPATPAPAAPPPVVTRDQEAAQRLEVARAKMANNLNDQALVDLQKIIVEYPNSKPAAEAAFMAAEIHEKAGNPDEAMAAFVEFESRFKGDARIPDAKMRRAMILARNTKNPRAQNQARDLLGEIARENPGTPVANAALQNKLKMESGRDREFREIDPVLKVQVPSELVTLRTIIEQFPNAPQTMIALNRLAVMLQNMDKWAETAQTLETLVDRFPGNPANAWFRLGDLYERRLNQSAKAKEAYARVPQDSPSYGEAQKRINKIK